MSRFKKKCPSNDLSMYPLTLGPHLIQWRALGTRYQITGIIRLSTLNSLWGRGRKARGIIMKTKTAVNDPINTCKCLAKRTMVTVYSQNTHLQDCYGQTSTVRLKAGCTGLSSCTALWSLNSSISNQIRHSASCIIILYASKRSEIHV